jgi:ATP-binding cassette subfamily B protein
MYFVNWRCFSFKNINISIKSGEKIALVGESGSGKITIAKL